MLKHIVGSAVLALVISGNAEAQTIFKYNNGTGYGGRVGQFTQSPAAGFNSNTFQVWCVDQLHFVSNNDSYYADVSRLDGSLANTRLNNVTSYSKAAWLAGHMGNGAHSSTTTDYQYAIWAAVHGKNASSYCTTSNFVIWYGNDSSCNSGHVTSLISDINLSQVQTDQWYIITGKDGSNHSYAGEDKQEFLAKCQVGVVGHSCSDGFTPPNFVGDTPNPEPATMSLLAMGLTGLAGASFRRRRKQS